MREKAATWISRAVNPLVLALVTFVILDLSIRNANWVSALVISITFGFILQVASLYLLNKLHIIPNIYVETGNRTISSLVAALIYLIGLWHCSLSGRPL